MVLIKDDHLPPLKWKLTIIEDLHLGTDGHMHVVPVSTVFLKNNGNRQLGIGLIKDLTNVLGYLLSQLLLDVFPR